MNSQQDQNQNQQSDQTQLTNGIQGTSSGPLPTGQQSQQKASSSGMTGFQNYQKANEGTATNRLSGAAAGNVANQASQAKTSINQATQAFNTKVDKGSLANRQNAVQDIKNVVDNARNITAGNGLDQGQTSRFQEVINAKYQGPESLRQSGDYKPAQEKVQSAETAIDQSKSALGREALLRNMYSQGGNYTQGLNKLDAGILNASSPGVENIQNIAKAQGDIGRQLDNAQIGSANIAQNRTQEIRNIRGEARDQFSQNKKAEEAQTEDRLSKVIQDWDKLPSYFKDIIRNKASVNQQVANTQVQDYTNSNQGVLNSYQDYQNAANPFQSAVSNAQSQLNSKNKAYTDAVNKYLNGQQDIFAGLNFNSLTPQQKLEKLAGVGFDATGYGASTAALNKSLAENQAKLKGIDSQYANQISAYNKYNTELNQLKENSANPNLNQIAFNPFEAAILGVNSGEGLYNLGENAIKTGVAEKDRLVSKDEQARQALLAQLAGLDQSQLLDTNLRYSDANRAGTQSILDSLDLEGTRKGLNEAEQNFRDTSKGTNLTGSGTKKVSRGNAFGKKTKKYTTSVGGNAGDFLEQAGYDLDAPLSQGSQVNGNDLLKSYLNATNTEKNNADLEDANKVISGTLGGAMLGRTGGSLAGLAATGKLFNMGGLIGAGVGAQVGAQQSSGTSDQYQQQIDVLQGYLPGAGQAIQDVRNVAGKGAEAATKYTPVTGIPDALLGGALSKGIGGMVGGIDSGAMKSYGTAVAKDLAVKNLQAHYRNYLESQGFGNRINVSEAKPVTDRAAILQQLLNSLDKTNT